MRGAGVRIGVAMAALVGHTGIVAAQSDAPARAPASAPAGAPVSVAASEPANRANDAVLDRTVTVDLSRVSLRSAIDAVAEKAGVRVLCKDEIFAAYTAPVSLHATDATLRKVFAHLFANTRLYVIPLANAALSIQEGQTTNVMAGGVNGTVVDAASGKPVSGAMVTVDDATETAAKTDEHGTFHLANIAAGTHRLGVRRIGFQPTHVAVRVNDGETAKVTVTMVGAAQTLNEVVTTAVGTRRRFEVGNSVGHLNADSIVKAQPIASVTELLANRIPGVDVRPENGLVGAATPIRIRGLNSMSLSNDPIIIVDGVRQENASGGRYASTLMVANDGGGVQSPSRINDVNPADIATIDVLKGPAAVTQYGTDAANGVIIITTKRGQAGPTRWSADVNHGWSSVPTDFPDIFYNYGHLTSDPAQIVACPYFGNDPSQPSVLAGTCAIDSVLHNNPLNHPFTTMYGSGPSTNANASMSGGNTAVTYSASMGYGTQQGTVKMPDALLPTARSLGYPDELLQPNGMVNRNARASLSAHPTSRVTVAINAAYQTTDQRAPSSTYLTRNMSRVGWRIDSTTNWGYGSPTGLNGVTNLGALGKEHHAGATFSAQGTVTPTSWLTASATTSLDHGLENTNDYIYPTAQQVLYNYPTPQGGLTVGNVTTDIASTSGYVTVNVPLSATVTSHTTGTASVTRNNNFGTIASSNSTGMSNTLIGVSDLSVSQIGTKTVSAGAGVQEDLIFAQRLFLTVGFREDGATGIGSNNPTAGYPSASVSWVALERPQGALSMLRLRSSYGASGRQPDPGETEQVLSASAAYVNNDVAPTWGLRSLGNPSLRPERSRELEYGFDLGLFDNRINVEFTQYHKVTDDQLVSSNLGITFYNWSYQQNLGRVQNTGTELGINGTVLQTNSVTWSGSLNYGYNGNKLLGLNPGYPVQSYGLGYQNKVGYPLNSIFTQLASYEDRNHDGMIDTSEITLTDSSLYLGSGFPKYTLGLSSELSLLHGNVSIGTTLNRTAGNWVYDETLVNMLNGQIPQNLFQQARLTAYGKYYAFGSLAYLNTTYTRWDELHVRFAVPAQLTRHTPFQSLSATFSVKNLATWTSFQGNDPTASNGGSINYVSYTGDNRINNDGRYYGDSSIPTPRTFSLSFSSNF